MVPVVSNDILKAVVVKYDRGTKLRGLLSVKGKTNLKCSNGMWYERVSRNLKGGGEVQN